jgi:hypothetical protein
MARTETHLSRIYLRPGQPVAPPERIEPVGTIEVGQLFRKSDAFRSLWQVTALFADGSGVIHARLCNRFDRTALKLISETALRNPRYYVSVAPSAPADAADRA